MKVLTKRPWLTSLLRWDSSLINTLKKVSLLTPLQSLCLVDLDHFLVISPCVHFSSVPSLLSCLSVPSFSLPLSFIYNKPTHLRPFVDVYYVRINKFGRGEDEDQIYRKLATFSFTSERRRVTVVYERVKKKKDLSGFEPYSAQGDIFVMTKGQDTAVQPLLLASRSGSTGNHALARVQLATQRMGRAGLRTMLVAEAKCSRTWWEAHQRRYKALEDELIGLQEGVGGNGRTEQDLTEALDRLETEIEQDAGLCLLGATGLEDELQDLVPEAIGDFLRAGTSHVLISLSYTSIPHLVFSTVMRPIPCHFSYFSPGLPHCLGSNRLLLN